MPDEGKAPSSPEAAVEVSLPTESAPQEARPSSDAHSLRPVGIDLTRPRQASDVGGAKEPGRPRRPRRALVVGSLAVCMAILVAAGMHRARSGGLAHSVAVAAAPAVLPAPVTPGATQPVETAAPAAAEAPAAWSDSFPGTLSTKTAPPSSPPAPAAATPAAVPVAPASGTGVVRVRHVAQGSVWIDGERSKAASITVSCGVHQVRVWIHGRARAIDVPCGGEIVVP